MEAVHKLRHHCLNFSHVGGGDAAALVRQQADIQPLIAGQGLHHMNLPGQILAALQALPDDKGPLSQSLQRIAGGRVLHPEEGLDRGVLADVRGHQADLGGLEAGSAVLILPLETEALHIQHHRQLPLLIGNIRVLRLIEQHQLSVLRLEAGERTAAALLRQCDHVLRQPEAAAILQGHRYHREVLRVHLADGRLEFRHTGEGLIQGIERAVLADIQAGQRL